MCVCVRASLSRFARCSHGPTPAQLEAGEGRSELLGEPGVRAAMPHGYMVGTVASEMPVLVHKGGAMEAPDGGETVVRVGVRHTSRLQVPVDEASEEGVRRALQGAHLAEKPDGVVVEQGMGDFEREEDFGPSPEEEEEAVDQVPVDFTEEKVGPATRLLTAADFYPAGDKHVEPYSSVKQQNERPGAGACELCECNPCQCDKLPKTYPYELSESETKRAGRPQLHHHTKKPVGGENRPGSSGSRDFRLHAKPRSEAHASMASKLGVHGVDKGGPATGAGPTWEEAEKLGIVSLRGRCLELMMFCVRACTLPSISAGAR